MPETLSVLSALKGKAVLVLVTLRNNRENLFSQLNSLGLTNYFKEILACSPLKLKSKIRPIKDYIEEQSKSGNFIFVGDTEVDVSTGKQLGMLTVAVTYGIRSKGFLKRLKPDFCLDNLSEIVKILEKIGNKR